jgi:hypothetical protein
MVNEMGTACKDKLPDALSAYGMAYKTLLGMYHISWYIERLAIYLWS